MKPIKIPLMVRVDDDLLRVIQRYAYRKFMQGHDIDVQFCLAHLIREVKFLTTLQDKVTAAYGRPLLDALCELFRAIHHRGAMPQERRVRRQRVSQLRRIMQAQAVAAR